MTTAVAIYIIVSVIVSVLVAAFLKGAALDGSLECKGRPARKSSLRRRGFVMAPAGSSGRRLLGQDYVAGMIGAACAIGAVAGPARG